MMAGSGTSGLGVHLEQPQRRPAAAVEPRSGPQRCRRHQGQDRVAFLRGDRSKENSDNFRTRNSILGDIINSSPATVGKAQYLTYLAQPIEPSGNYSTFAEAQKTRAPRVYVGANDGMLHGFDTDGNETFAFIPSAVFEKLHKLTARGYQGRRPPVLCRRFAGGRRRLRRRLAYRADRQPACRRQGPVRPRRDRSRQHQAALGNRRGPGARPGLQLPKPTVARLHNGKWAVVTGNGYSSLNDKAALLIIDLETGAITRKLEVTGRTGVPNGPAPRLADNSSDGVADYAYAGDPQGNLWRFDLIAGKVNQDDPFSRANDGPAVASSFRVSFGGQPLHSAVDSAGAAQAITAAPRWFAIRHARAGIVISAPASTSRTATPGPIPAAPRRSTASGTSRPRAKPRAAHPD